MVTKDKKQASSRLKSELLELLVLAPFIIFLSWVFISWVEVVTHNSNPETAVLISNLNFFKMFFHG